MAITKAKRRASLPADERPEAIKEAISHMKDAADYLAAAIKSAEGALRHASRGDMQNDNEGQDRDFAPARQRPAALKDRTAEATKQEIAMTHAAPTRLITLVETCARTGKSRWWLRTEWLAGRFPKPVPCGYRATMFVDSEVEAWVRARIAARDRARGQDQ